MAAAAARPPAPAPAPPTMVIQDGYIDMDLTPSATPLPPPSPRFEFQSAALGDVSRRGGKEEEEEEAALPFASPADELFYRGKLLPLHLPPRLQLVQRLLQEQTQQGVQRDADESRLEMGDDGGAADKAAVVQAARGGQAVGVSVASSTATNVLKNKKPSWSKRLKAVKRWASRDYIRSLFLARPGSDIVVDGGAGTGSVSARTPPVASGRDHEEPCHHRKSFSGIVRRVRLVVATGTAKAAAAAAPPGVSPLCSSSSCTSSSSSTPSCGAANGFFFRAAAAPSPTTLKRSSSAGSEEGAIQGAIAHCKRSQLQQQQGMAISSSVAAARRSSASDVVFYSVTNTPRASSVAAGEVERQEMCRG